MTTRPIDANERLDILRLARTETIGPITYLQLIDRFGSAGEAIASLPDLAARGGRRRPLKIPSRADAKDEIKCLEKLGGKMIALGEPAYPSRLAAIDDPPPVLSVLGDPSLLQQRAVAIVGARNASLAGSKIAGRIAHELGETGLVIVSGLARGIDTAAHEQALASGTVAVMASGLDIVYPRENEKLFAQIRAQGTIISEHPLGTQPMARYFPRRNRIVSGLALGVVVVEAARRSGSLITARVALEQGRELFAVPGSPLDPRALGSNHLIRQGATLTETSRDVLEVIETLHTLPFKESRQEIPLRGRPPMREQDPKEVDAARIWLLDKLGPVPFSLDEVLRQCHMSLPVVMTALLELELAGRAMRLAGGRVLLIDMQGENAAGEQKDGF
ncbi:MAG: DNA-processing protein DprA [Pseudomonadota bacterium]|nr:DNA-processing protein DprA [Pseudomonadota bacterium]